MGVQMMYNARDVTGAIQYSSNPAAEVVRRQSRGTGAILVVFWVTIQKSGLDLGGTRQMVDLNQLLPVFQLPNSSHVSLSLW